MYLANIGAFVTAYAHSDLFGKLIILGLVLLSVICWVVLIQDVWITREVARVSAAFKRAYLLNKDKLLHLELDKLPKPTNKLVPHPFGALLRELTIKTVEILNKNLHFQGEGKKPVYLSSADLESVETHVLTTLSSQTKHLEKRLFILSTIVTLAPFLGLLGTVWGILVSFGELGQGSSASSNMAVLGGLSTALSTTVLGLIIAIPALVAYNYLKNAVRHYSADMEEFLYELLSTLELQYRKVDPP